MLLREGDDEGLGPTAVTERAWLRRGLEDIVVLEARFCGAGASGRCSGFITPASELGVSELRRRFGDDEARLLWDLAQGGCDSIRETIERDARAMGRW